MLYVTYKGQKYYVRDGRLDLIDKGVSDIFEIKGLETLTNLQGLNLKNNQISEIKGLEMLTNLEKLCLDFNQISEIKGLEMLINLESLELVHNEITEIRGLENLNNLLVLNLGHNKITKIKGLETLIRLQLLALNGNKITEIRGLETLMNLLYLYLDSNQITEIEGLETLLNLEQLDLYNNPIKEKERDLLFKPPYEIVEYCRVNKQKSYEFDFAFSFAGEDRDIVEKLYNSLTKKRFKLFYDKPFEWDLGGKDLANRFKEVYGKNSKYVVLFVSKHYPVKEWTNFEFQIARDEAKKRKEEFIIPIRLDETNLFGLKNTIGYFDYHQRGTRKISELLSKKLEVFNKRHNITKR